MEKKFVKVPYNEKRLQFLDPLLPRLILENGEIIYDFDYFFTQQAMFIRKLNEFGSPVVPYKLWNFSGQDVSSYFNHIKEIEFNQAGVYDAALEVYPNETPEFHAEIVEKHLADTLAMGDGKCDARNDIEETINADRVENERRQNLLQKIADQTAGDADALPSPEVMQLRMEANQAAIDATFTTDTISTGEITPSGIEVVKPNLITSTNDDVSSSGLITSLNEPAKPTKLIL